MPASFASFTLSERAQDYRIEAFFRNLFVPAVTRPS